MLLLKNTRKIIALVLTICLLLSVFPPVAVAASGGWYMIYDEDEVVPERTGTAPDSNIAINEIPVIESAAEDRPVPTNRPPVNRPVTDDWVDIFTPVPERPPASSQTVSNRPPHESPSLYFTELSASASVITVPLGTTKFLDTGLKIFAHYTNGTSSWSTDVTYNAEAGFSDAPQIANLPGNGNIVASSLGQTVVRLGFTDRELNVYREVAVTIKVVAPGTPLPPPSAPPVNRPLVNAPDSPAPFELLAGNYIKENTTFLFSSEINGQTFHNYRSINRRVIFSGSKFSLENIAGEYFYVLDDKNMITRSTDVLIKTAFLLELNTDLRRRKNEILQSLRKIINTSIEAERNFQEALRLYHLGQNFVKVGQGVLEVGLLLGGAVTPIKFAVEQAKKAVEKEIVNRIRNMVKTEDYLRFQSLYYLEKTLTASADAIALINNKSAYRNNYIFNYEHGKKIREASSFAGMYASYHLVELKYLNQRISQAKHDAWRNLALGALSKTKTIGVINNTIKVLDNGSAGVLALAANIDATLDPELYEMERKVQGYKDVLELIVYPGTMIEIFVNHSLKDK